VSVGGVGATGPEDVVTRAKAALEGISDGPWDLDLDPDDYFDKYDVPVYDAATNSLSSCPDCGVRGGFGERDAHFVAAARSLVPELIAEVERLHSWDGLMSLLDEHYPEDIFPTMADRDDRDPGPRIISLLRMLDRAKTRGGCL